MLVKWSGRGGNRNFIRKTEETLYGLIVNNLKLCFCSQEVTNIDIDPFIQKTLKIVRLGSRSIRKIRDIYSFIFFYIVSNKNKNDRV